MTWEAWCLIAAAILLALAIIVAFVAWSDWCEARAMWELAERAKGETRDALDALADQNRRVLGGKLGIGGRHG